jgi:hypothetical protein
LPGSTANALHCGKIDHNAVVAQGVAGHAVGAAANGRRHISLTSKFNGRDHVLNGRTPHNQSRSLVDHSIEDPARFCVAAVTWLNEVSVQICV